MFYLEVPNEPIYLKQTLPLKRCFLKNLPATEGVWNSNGVTHSKFVCRFYSHKERLVKQLLH